jgi:hypothetical protein
MGWSDRHAARRTVDGIIDSLSLAPQRIIVSRTSWVACITSPHGPGDPITRLVLLGVASALDRGQDTVALTIADITSRTALGERAVRTHLRRASAERWIRITGPRTRRAYGPCVPADIRHRMPVRAVPMRRVMPDHTTTDRHDMPDHTGERDGRR